MKNLIKTEIHLISFHDYANKKILVFRKTSSACPTQYDIYEGWEDKKPNYYGRLRHGYFYVAEGPLKKPIYEIQFKDELKGFFYNFTEERKYLMEACNRIWQNQKKKKNGTKSKKLKRKEK